MKKFSGITMITISSVIGLGNALTFGDHLIVSFILLFLISLPLFIFGYITITSLAEFKHKGKRYLSIYIYFLFILPIAFYLYNSYDQYKRHLYADEQFIIYRSVSGELGKLSMATFIILIVLLAARFLNPILKRKALLNIIIISTSIFLVGFNYFMLSDYRGVHEEKGLISSTWKGDETVISYQEIDSIHIEPFVFYRSLTSPASDETRFMWKVIFQPSHDQGEIVYQFYRVNKQDLEQTYQVKEIAIQHDIPFTVGHMSEEIIKWFDLDLELEELDKGRYYELFQVKK